jgi:hypothetical protein
MLRITLASTFVLTLLSSLATASTIAVGPSQSIQAAIVSAQAGDRIELAPGTYHEAIDFLGKDITVVGVGGSKVTILDGTGLTKSIVTFQSQETPLAVLEGVTLSGANSTTFYGAGLRVANFSDPTVRHCRFIGNVAPKGGGMAVTDSSATVEHCLFEGNTAHQVWGFPNGALGGGLLYYGGSELRISDCTFRQNVGQGLHADLSGTVLLARTRFEDHATREAASLNWVNPVVEDCVFVRNSAGGLFVGTYGDVFVLRSQFIDNAHAMQGAGAFLFAGPNVQGTQVIRVESCVFARNQAPSGSALWVVIDNEAFDDPPPEATAIESCTFVANGPGSTIHNAGEGAFIHNSIVRGTSAPYSGGPSLVVEYSNIQGGFAGTGNVDVDPLFVDMSADDLHLQAGSPCIASGDPAGPFAKDVDGNVRDVAGQNEMGADERKPALAFTGDTAVGTTIRVAIHGDPTPGPTFLLLGTNTTPGPGPFLLQLPVVVLELPTLPPAGFLAFIALVPAGIQPLTVHAQTWTGAALTGLARVDLW